MADEVAAPHRGQGTTIRRFWRRIAVRLGQDRPPAAREWKSIDKGAGYEEKQPLISEKRRKVVASSEMFAAVSPPLALWQKIALQHAAYKSLAVAFEDARQSKQKGAQWAEHFAREGYPVWAAQIHSELYGWKTPYLPIWSCRDTSRWTHLSNAISLLYTRVNFYDIDWSQTEFSVKSEGRRQKSLRCNLFEYAFLEVGSLTAKQDICGPFLLNWLLIFDSNLIREQASSSELTLFSRIRCAREIEDFADTTKDSEFRPSVSLLCEQFRECITAGGLRIIRNGLFHSAFRPPLTREHFIEKLRDVQGAEYPSFKAQ